MVNIESMKLLKHLIPIRVKILLRHFVKKKFGFKDQQEIFEELRKEFLNKRAKEEEMIPKVELQQKHIAQLKVLLDRSALLNEMPKHSICAEIGVDQGDFSKAIFQITMPTKLHLIDAWGDPNRYHDDLKLAVKERFNKEIEEEKIEINLGFSTEVLKTFPDNYFDWVYLDTDHTYKTTAAELSILKTKLKKTGIIAGHDYTIGNWIGNFRYGVIEAVHEFCVTDDWQLLFITSETNQCRNFAIKRLE
jgi:hypothetical protein